MNTTIETTLGDVAAAYPAIRRLLKAKLSYQAACDIGDVSLAMAPKARHHEEQRAALVTELGVERDATADDIAQGHARTLQDKVLSVTPENWPAFLERKAALDAVTVTLTFKRIDPAALSGVEITAEEQLTIRPFLELKEAATT